MILFQLAQWMEERTRLTRTISETQATEGDTMLLEHQKEQVEEQLRTQASKWLDESLETAFLAQEDVSGRAAQAESAW